MKLRALALFALLFLSACSTSIRGTVQLVDSRQQPITNDNPKGAVVNMINTKAAVEQASTSAAVNEKGEFVDPWGTPVVVYFAGNSVLVRSAGPNRKWEDARNELADDIILSN